ncbi:MAG: flagellar hook-length control protein FliK [Armatimonadota bacterium]|nr:flagellar hook-length control protein FliK [Armatimonadota bacterium]
MTVCALPNGLPAGSAAAVDASGGSLCVELTSAFEQHLADALNAEAKFTPAAGFESSAWAALLPLVALQVWGTAASTTLDSVVPPTSSEARSQQGLLTLLPPLLLDEPKALDLSSSTTPDVVNAVSVLDAGGKETQPSPIAHPHANMLADPALAPSPFLESEGAAAPELAARRVELLPQAPPTIGRGSLVANEVQSEAVAFSFEEGGGVLVGEVRREQTLNPLAEVSTLRHRGQPEHALLSFDVPMGQAQATPPAPPYHPDTAAPVGGELRWQLAEQLSQQIEQMAYQREQNTLTMRLDPPELGVIEIRIQATGTEVQAWVSAEQESTRQMLMQAQQHLREQLEARGLQLTHFDVGGGRHFAFARPFRTPFSATWQTAFRTPVATESLVYDGRWSVWV